MTTAPTAFASLVPFQGPKKSRFSGPTPSNAPRNAAALLKTITGILIVIRLPLHVENKFKLLLCSMKTLTSSENYFPVACPEKNCSVTGGIILHFLSTSFNTGFNLHPFRFHRVQYIKDAAIEPRA
jgi:hypothetical protein